VLVWSIAPALPPSVRAAAAAARSSAAVGVLWDRTANSKNEEKKVNKGLALCF
jgi:hypothetical protein